MPGLASVQPNGEPVSESAPGHTLGLTIPGRSRDTRRAARRSTAPVVLNRRHVSASSRAGKFALAATANARPTMNETFRPAAADDRDRDRDRADRRPRRSRATQTSSCSESLPLRMMLDQMSCATAPDADSTRPATTARIVANATPAMMARNRSPPNVPAPPPSSAARFGAARLPPVPAASTPSCAEDRARAEADERGQQVEEADQEHRPDDRAARRLGVRHGEEPHQDVRQARRAEHEREAERDRVDRRVEERARAERERRLSAVAFSSARLNSSIGLKPTLPSTNTDITTMPVISSTALMICTHVVATMPPKTT